MQFEIAEITIKVRKVFTESVRSQDCVLRPANVLNFGTKLLPIGRDRLDNTMMSVLGILSLVVCVLLCVLFIGGVLRGGVLPQAGY